MVNLSKDPSVTETSTPEPGISALDSKREEVDFVKLQDEFGSYLMTVMVSLILLCIAFLGLLRLAYVSGRHNDGFLVILVGALLGWAAGMFFSPYTTVEKSNFVSISQAVSAFVSGYLLSKLDRFLESSLFSMQGPVASTWTLIGFFSVAFMVFALGTYSCRRYFAAAEIDEAYQGSKKKDATIAVAQSGSTQPP